MEKRQQCVHSVAGDDVATDAESLRVGWGRTQFWDMSGSQFTNSWKAFNLALESETRGLDPLSLQTVMFVKERQT